MYVLRSYLRGGVNDLLFCIVLQLLVYTFRYICGFNPFLGRHREGVISSFWSKPTEFGGFKIGIMHQPPWLSPRIARKITIFFAFMQKYALKTHFFVKKFGKRQMFSIYLSSETDKNRFGKGEEILSTR